MSVSTPAAPPRSPDALSLATADRADRALPAWAWAVAAFVLVLIGFGLRLYRIEFQSIWWDEGFSRNLATLPFGEMVRFASTNDTHPLGYHLALKLGMRLAGDTELALRYVSLIPGVLSLPLIYRIGRRIGGPAAGLVALTLLAVSPFHVAYSQETRMYAQVTFLGLAATWFLLRAVETGRWPWWVAYGSALGLGLQTHYSMALLGVGQGLWLLVRLASVPHRAGREVLGVALAGATALLVFLPWLPLGVGQVLGFESAVTEPTALDTALARYGRQAFGGPLFEGESPESFWIPLAALAGLVAVGVVLWSALRRHQSRMLWLLAPCLVAAPVAAYAVILARKPMYHPRYLLILLPYVLLVFALAATDRRLPGRPVRTLLLVPVVALAGIGLSGYYFDPAAQRDENRAMVAYIEQQAAARGVTPVALVDTSAYSIDYYVRDRFPAYRLENPTHAEAVDAFRAAAATAPYIYHITWFKTGSDRRLMIPYLLERYGEPVSTRGFFGGTITEYHLLRQPADADLLGPVRPETALFDGTLRLTGAGSGAGASGVYEPGGRLWAVLRWRLENDTSVDFRAGLRLVDAAGRTYGTSDRTLVAGEQRYTSDWRPGEEELSFFSLPIDPGTPPGTYTLTVSVYDRVDPGRTLEHDHASDPTRHNLPLARIEVIDASARPTAPLPELRGEPAVAGALHWLGHGPLPSRVRAGDRLDITGYWRAAGDLARTPRYQLEVIGPDGRSTLLGAPEPVGDAAGAGWTWRAGTVRRTYPTGRLPADLPPGPYAVRLLLESDGNQVAAPLAGTLDVVAPDRSQDLPPMDRTLDQDFGPAITLAGFSSSAGAVSPLPARVGPPLDLTLVWQATGTTDTAYTVFIQVLDESNRLVAQHDAPPAGGEWPTDTWTPGQVVSDSHQIVLPDGPPPGRYRLIAGLYDPRTGARLPPTGQSADFVVLDEVVVR